MSSLQLTGFLVRARAAPSRLPSRTLVYMLTPLRFPTLSSDDAWHAALPFMNSYLSHFNFVGMTVVEAMRTVLLKTGAWKWKDAGGQVTGLALWWGSHVVMGVRPSPVCVVRCSATAGIPTSTRSMTLLMRRLAKWYYKTAVKPTPTVWPCNNYSDRGE